MYLPFWALYIVCILSVYCCNLDKIKGFSSGSDSRESAWNVRDLGSPPVLGRFPGKGNSYPFPVFLSGTSQGQRSLEGYSPWGHIESDMTEQLTLSFSLHGRAKKKKSNNNKNSIRRCITNDYLLPYILT